MENSSTAVAFSSSSLGLRTSFQRPAIYEVFRNYPQSSRFLSRFSDLTGGAKGYN